MEELRGGADVVLKKIMRQAAAERASDVHIEPGASCGCGFGRTGCFRIAFVSLPPWRRIFRCA